MGADVVAGASAGRVQWFRNYLVLKGVMMLSNGLHTRSSYIAHYCPSYRDSLPWAYKREAERGSFAQS